MLPDELADLVHQVQTQRCETQLVEVKAARDGCPKRLYDTLSSFSNQDEGGTIVFGVDENAGFAVVGVYDAQDLQKHVVEQCDQMCPPVRAVFTTVTLGDSTVVSAEIPGIDVSDRPCYYQGKGRLRGSYVRVADADEPMTEYEIYSYEAFRKQYHDEVEPVPRATLASLDQSRLNRYLTRLRSSKPNLARLEDDKILELMSVTRNGEVTLAGVMLFSLYPQAYFPQLAIIATVVPGTEAGVIDEQGNRFLDNKRIEGTLSEQLEGALAFVATNMRVSTHVDSSTGRRADQAEYPIEAIRELVLNALIHRDYSPHTQNMPIQLLVYRNRLEVVNPGGLYGRLTVNDLGKVQPDTRNPVIATIMETLGETENRYSGIPTVRRLLDEAGMPEPLFESSRGQFRVTLRSERSSQASGFEVRPDLRLTDIQRKVVLFCAEEPRSRQEIAELVGVQAPYAMRRYVKPMVEAGLLEQTLPDAPKSSYQRYVTPESLITRRS